MKDRNSLNTLWALVIRDLKIRYVGSILGLFWSMINPLILIVLYTVIFSMVMKVKIGDTATPMNFGILVYCGLLPWLTIQDTIFRASVCLVENARLVRRMPIPLYLFPLATVAVSLINQLMALVIFIPFIWFFFPIKLNLTLLLPAFLSLSLYSCGLALLLSSAHVIERDIAPLATAFSTIWFFGTPIIYIYSMIPPFLAKIIYFNPLTSLVGLYRTALIGSPLPHFSSLIFLSVSSLLTFILGIVIFGHLQGKIYDRL